MNIQIRSTISRINLNVVQSSYQVYTVSSITIVVVFVTVDDAILSDDVVTRTFDNIVGNNQVPNIFAFQPESKLCMCTSIYILIQYLHQTIQSAIFYHVPVAFKSFVIVLLLHKNFRANIHIL